MGDRIKRAFCVENHNLADHSWTLNVDTLIVWLPVLDSSTASYIDSNCLWDSFYFGTSGHRLIVSKVAPCRNSHASSLHLCRWIIVPHGHDVTHSSIPLHFVWCFKCKWATEQCYNLNKIGIFNFSVFFSFVFHHNKFTHRWIAFKNTILAVVCGGARCHWDSFAGSWWVYFHVRRSTHKNCLHFIHSIFVAFFKGF